MPEDIGSTVPRRQLGRLLRQFRNEAGVTLDAAAEALEYSRQKIWRLECGQGSVRVLDVKAMCELYGVSPEMTEAMRGAGRGDQVQGLVARVRRCGAELVRAVRRPGIRRLAAPAL